MATHKQLLSSRRQNEIPDTFPEGDKATGIHGDRAQLEREAALRGFKVETRKGYVAARGFNVVLCPPIFAAVDSLVEAQNWKIEIFEAYPRSMVS